MSSSEYKYLFSLYELSLGFELVRIVDLAKATGISKASVFHALERLLKKGYATKSGEMGSYQITDSGIMKIKSYISYVKIFEGFLMDSLKLNKEEAHQNAIELSCSLSDSAREAFIGYIEKNK